eukprot:17579_6
MDEFIRDKKLADSLSDVSLDPINHDSWEHIERESHRIEKRQRCKSYPRCQFLVIHQGKIQERTQGHEYWYRTHNKVVYSFS